MRRLARYFTALILAAGLVAGIAPAASAAPLRSRISTNIPKAAGGSAAQQYATLNLVADLVDRTPRGATINVSMYSQNRYRNPGQRGASVMYRFERAVKRGVHVRWVTFGQGNGKEMRRLTRAIHRKHDRQSWVKVCRGACLVKGNGGIHHTKAITFSSTAGRKFVTVIMSGNLTRSSAKDQWNDADLIVNNWPIYHAVNVHILRMRADRWQGTQKAVRSGAWAVYFYPQPRKPQDPFLSRLRQIKCKYTTGRKHHRVKHRGVVLVNMAFWSGHRNLYTRELGRKRRQGCTVYVAFSGQIVSASVKRQLKRDHVPTWDAHKGGSYTHSKSAYMFGKFGRNVTGISLTGSANLTKAGQRGNDDTILETVSPTDYRLHAGVFNRIRAHSRRLW